MNLSLVDALGQAELEMGQVYRYQVNGRLVELRVLDPAPEAPSTLSDESDIMLDPWVELPRPAPVARVKVRAGRLDDPSIPDIPRDDDPS